MDAEIVVYKIVQGVQLMGGSDDHMYSRVYFFILVDGEQKHGGVIIKQTAGSDYSDPFEVRPPEKGADVADYISFRNFIEDTYRHFIGPGGAAFNISGGTNIRMINNKVLCSYKGLVKLSGSPGEAGW